MEVVTAAELEDRFGRLQGSIEALGSILRDAVSGTRTKRYFNREEAAEYLGLSTRVISRLCADGQLACIKYGDGNSSPVRFRRSDLDAYAESCRIPMRSPAESLCFVRRSKVSDR